MLAVTSITFTFVVHMKCGLWNKQKQQGNCYTWTETS